MALKLKKTKKKYSKYIYLNFFFESAGQNPPTFFFFFFFGKPYFAPLGAY